MNLIKNVCYNYLPFHTCNVEYHAIEQLAIGFAARPLITLIHELGHATAARLLFLNSNPKIKITYNGGNCSYYSTHLSKVGEWLGYRNAITIIAAAGPIVQMKASLALLRFFPGNGISAISLLNNTFYAISALSEKGFFTGKYEVLSHDFVHIKFYKGELAANTLIITSVALGIFGVYSLIQESLANAYS